MTWRTSLSASFGSVEAERTWLREENARLRRLLAEHNIPVPPSEVATQSDAKPIEVLSSEARAERARKRITLFRSLFRGREDVSHNDGRAQTGAQVTHRLPGKTGKR